ncbi:MAG: bifunctional folylpolyglutamate synthase/dihydrofolate synthase, partial [Clostridia bacterium]
GFRTGFYTSPAVYSRCETIKINQQNIDKESLAAAVTRARQGAEAMIEDGLFPPTEFEIMTAAAYWYFREQNCDFVVVECGMGGRLDATNVLQDTAVSVLTRIDYDHTGFLGRTLTEITREKCGILRPGRPVVVYPLQEPEVLSAICQTAAEQDCKLYIPRPEMLQTERSNADGSVFSYEDYQALTIPLCGTHQCYNALTALEAVRALRDAGVAISEAAIRRGLAGSSWPGRFEVLSKEPPVVLDGAHNHNGVCAFAATLRQCFAGRSFIGVMGMLRDKDYQASLSELAGICSLLILTEVLNPRSADCQALAQTARTLGIPFLVEPEPGAAVAKAFSLRRENQGIFCAGSLYNLAVFKEKCQNLIQ